MKRAALSILTVVSGCMIVSARPVPIDMVAQWYYQPNQLLVLTVLPNLAGVPAGANADISATPVQVSGSDITIGAEVSTTWKARQGIAGTKIEIPNLKPGQYRVIDKVSGRSLLTLDTKDEGWTDPSLKPPSQP